MFNDFLMFVAPGIVIIAAIFIAFQVAIKGAIDKDENE